MMDDLFEDQIPDILMSEGAILLSRYAKKTEHSLVAALNEVIKKSSLRHMTTTRGFSLSVATTNCGELGWISDEAGYRYQTKDPLSGNPWPPMPEVFKDLAIEAASKAGYANFKSDACLINRYEPGAQMSLHQDKNEKDFDAPIVSVSLGLPATFLFGGINLTDPVKKFSLVHGDVVVWGGPSRLFYHGILPLKKGNHHLLGNFRINLTFRKAAY